MHPDVSREQHKGMIFCSHFLLLPSFLLPSELHARYGLLGPNGAGKTTLMRNIANGAIDGLPTELRTVFVQHDIVGSEVRAGGTPRSANRTARYAMPQ